MKFSIIAIFAIISISLKGETLSKFSFEGNTGQMYTLDSISNVELPLVNHYNKPERIEGVIGKALKLDGNSTWASNTGMDFSSVQKQFSIEAWYATPCFSPENASIFCQEDEQSGCSLSVSPLGSVIWSFTADQKKYTFTSTKQLETYRWNHIVADIDLSNQSCNVYVNGENWININLEKHNTLSMNSTTLYIGRSNRNKSFDGYLLSVLNGALDEITLNNTVLSPGKVMEHYEANNNKTPDLSTNVPLLHGTDYLRPKFHPMPSTGWANESYGMLFYEGKYHMFFQKNPNFPSLYFMHWGHLSSTDLVQWEEEKITLRPSIDFDHFGIWSGTTILNNEGEPNIYYTGVDGVKAGIGYATPKDGKLVDWLKPTDNPVFKGAPGGYNHMDFRDPYIWKMNDAYYMVVGSGKKDMGGGFLFCFKSADLQHWRILDPIYSRTDVDKTGIFWEMPSVVYFGNDIYMLSITPVPKPGNKARTIYWTGTFDQDKFIPFDDEPKSFELIDGNLLSPAFGLDENGQVIYSAIIPESRKVEDQKEAGWRHTFSTVRYVRLLSDRKTIGHTPHPNLCRLREQHVSVSNEIIKSGTVNNLADISGNQLEMNFEIDVKDASLFKIQVLASDDKTEHTDLIFDIKNSRIKFDRRFSTTLDAQKDVQEAYYKFNKYDPLRINIFLDHSIIEVFVDQLVVFSGRIYPSNKQNIGVDFVVTEGSTNILQLDAWQLKSLGDSMNNVSCIPEILPDEIYTKTKTSNSAYDQKQIQAFPEANGIRFTIFAKQQGKANIHIYDITGTKMSSTPIVLKNGKNTVYLENATAFKGIPRVLLAVLTIDNNYIETIKIQHLL